MEAFLFIITYNPDPVSTNQTYVHVQEDEEIMASEAIEEWMKQNIPSRETLVENPIELGTGGNEKAVSIGNRL